MNASVNNSSSKTSFHVTAILCGIALLNTASAEDRFSEPDTKVVSYADLNLNTPAGAQTLYGRLRAAAAVVCKQHESPTLKGMSRQRACFDQAIARAVEQIDSAMVTAYHLARTGKTERPVRVAVED